jgi:hypothetical protein
MVETASMQDHFLLVFAAIQSHQHFVSTHVIGAL